MCYKAEHIKHIVTLCIKLVPSEYNNRHNKVDDMLTYEVTGY